MSLTPFISGDRTDIIEVNGPALVEMYITVLSNVTFVNDADEPGPSNRTIVFELTDDRGFSFTASTLVFIIPTNDPAVFTFNNSVVVFDEMARTPVKLFQPNDTLTDPDGNTLWWLTVQIWPSVDEMDILSADPDTSNSVDVDLNADMDMLNISGYANFSIYEMVLQTVTFSNLFPGINLANRTIRIVTFDGETESPPTLINLRIDAFDDIPMCYFNAMVSVE